VQCSDDGMFPAAVHTSADMVDIDQSGSDVAVETRDDNPADD